MRNLKTNVMNVPPRANPRAPQGRMAGATGTVHSGAKRVAQYTALALCTIVASHGQSVRHSHSHGTEVDDLTSLLVGLPNAHSSTEAPQLVEHSGRIMLLSGLDRFPADGRITDTHEVQQRAPSTRSCLRAHTQRVPYGAAPGPAGCGAFGDTPRRRGSCSPHAPRVACAWCRPTSGNRQHAGFALFF